MLVASLLTVTVLLTLMRISMGWLSIGWCLRGPGVKVKGFCKLVLVRFGLLQVWKGGMWVTMEWVWLVCGCSYLFAYGCYCFFLNVSSLVGRLIRLPSQAALGHLVELERMGILQLLTPAVFSYGERVLLLRCGRRHLGRRTRRRGVLATLVRLLEVSFGGVVASCTTGNHSTGCASHCLSRTGLHTHSNLLKPHFTI